LSALTVALADSGKMDLSFAPDRAVLVREPGSAVFVAVRYSLS
jgi:hypothetical protein